ncbi:MAG: hypothetical protein AAGD96_23230 [Chloroflexota bacterium]
MDVVTRMTLMRISEGSESDFWFGYMDYLVDEKHNRNDLHIYPAVEAKLKTDSVFRQMFFNRYRNKYLAVMDSHLRYRRK